MLIACKECGHEISDTATACPDCGAPTGRDNIRPTVASTKKKGTRWYTWLVLIIFVLYLIGRFADEDGTTARLPTCESAEAEGEVRRLVEKNKTAINNIEIIVFKNPKTISSTQDKVECEAEVYLNNTAETTISYEFFKNEDGVFVEYKLDSTP